MLASIKRTNITRNRSTTHVTSQCRHRHSQQAHKRQINIQLLSDIPNVGKLGTIQAVAPGLMRSILYPQGKAVYLLKGVAPRLPPLIDSKSGASSFRDDVVDFANIKSRLEALAPLVFYRHLRSMDRRNPAVTPSSGTAGQPIFGSVTLHDITQRLSENHGLSLVPPDGILSLRGEGLKDKLKSTGMFTVLAHLRTGDIIPFKVTVEPEVEPKERVPEQSPTISGSEVRTPHVV